MLGGNVYVCAACACRVRRLRCDCEVCAASKETCVYGIHVKVVVMMCIIGKAIVTLIGGAGEGDHQVWNEEKEYERGWKTRESTAKRRQSARAVLSRTRGGREGGREELACLDTSLGVAVLV